ncbi:MAG: hypothetical protein WCK96_05525 [Methylococcales bacterium]
MFHSILIFMLLIFTSNAQSESNGNQQNFAFSLYKCDKIALREVRGDVNGSVDLANEAIVSDILQKGAEFAMQTCPQPTHGFTSIAVYLYQNNQSIVHARNYEENQLTWREYSNQSIANRQNRERTQLVEQEKNANIAKLESEKNNINAREVESKNIYSNFTTKNNISDFPSYEQLMTNPFIFKEKVIGVEALFDEMISEEDGLFHFNNGGSFILSKVPTNMFSRKTNILLAATVIGKTQNQTLRLSFIDAYLCKQENCDDILFWKQADSNRDNINRNINDNKQSITQGNKEAIDSYFYSVNKMIQGNLIPLFKVSRDIKLYEVTATVFFGLNPDGHYSELTLNSGSGDTAFDTAFLNSFKPIDVFPSFPSALPTQRLGVWITISYKSEGGLSGTVVSTPYQIRYEPINKTEEQKPQTKSQEVNKDQVESNVVTVGSTYVTESFSLDKPEEKSIMERKIVANENEKITVATTNIKNKSQKPRILEFTKDGNLLSSRNADGSGSNFAPPIKYFDFPLYSGKKWQEKTTETNIKTGSVRQHVIFAIVGEWETISVPAGIFQGIKITLETELIDSTTGEKTTGTDTSWYVPEIGRSVKSVISSRNADGKEQQQIIQLISYKIVLENQA